MTTIHKRSMRRVRVWVCCHAPGPIYRLWTGKRVYIHCTDKWGWFSTYAYTHDGGGWLRLEDGGPTSFCKATLLAAYPTLPLPMPGKCLCAWIEVEA